MEAKGEEDFKKGNVPQSQLPKKRSSWTRNKKSINEAGNQDITTGCASFPKMMQ